MPKNYYQAIGRRKRARARIRLVPGKGEIFINGKKIEKIHPYIIAPFKLTGLTNKFNLSAKSEGGGYKSTLEAIRLGVARSLVKFDEKLKPTLRKAGFLTRDPREKERKKPGLKRARRAPQWSKR